MRITCNVIFCSVDSEKIRNIEVTEDAKRKLLQERMNKKDSGISDFVPTNMAVNFVQHNRCKGVSSIVIEYSVTLSLPEVESSRLKGYINLGIARDAIFLLFRISQFLMGFG